MTLRPRRLLLAVALAALYLAHDDFWLRHDPQLVLGLPVGLLYHVGYCVAASLLMALCVAWAWPEPVGRAAGATPTPQREGPP